MLVTGCLAGPGFSPSSSAPGSGVPVGELGNLDVEQLREALLGEPPYPSGWEEQVDELIGEITALLEEIRVPDVTGLDEVDAACATWRPLVGNTDWATGALVERQSFIAHVAALAQVAPTEVRPAAEDALVISSAAAAEQIVADGDPAVISRFPEEAVRTIGLWAVANCDLPIEADEPPDTRGWTRDEIAQACTWDREWLENAQEDYVEGPGQGRYAEHPHELEVTLETFSHPAWHQLALDNRADPPTFEVEPIPGSFCDV